MRDALAAGTLRWSVHLGQRRGQRNVQVMDVKEALASAGLPQRSTSNPGEAWVFEGTNEDGDRLKVVVGFDDTDPTIVTVWWV